jgi:hypothetical protein
LGPVPTKPQVPIPVTPIATDDPTAIKVREPVRTIGTGDDAIELRAFSPEERARRRLKKNLILWAIGLIVIGITLAILLMTGPISL